MRALLYSLKPGRWEAESLTACVASCPGGCGGRLGGYGGVTRAQDGGCAPCTRIPGTDGKAITQGSALLGNGTFGRAGPALRGRLLEDEPSPAAVADEGVILMFSFELFFFGRGEVG